MQESNRGCQVIWSPVICDRCRRHETQGRRALCDRRVFCDRRDSLERRTTADVKARDMRKGRPTAPRALQEDAHMRDGALKLE